MGLQKWIGFFCEDSGGWKWLTPLSKAAIITWDAEVEILTIFHIAKCFHRDFEYKTSNTANDYMYPQSWSVWLIFIFLIASPNRTAKYWLFSSTFSKHSYLLLVGKKESPAPNSRHWSSQCCRSKYSQSIRAPMFTHFEEIDLQIAYL